VWWGVSALAGGDGLLAIAPAEQAALLRRGTVDPDLTPLESAVAEALDGSGGLFFRDVHDRVASTAGATVTDDDVVEALWGCVWAGLVTNDSTAALRARLGRRSATRPRGRLRLPSRSGPAAGAGRWSRLGPMTGSAQERSRALGEALLERYGVVTRTGIAAERIEGGFAGVYRVLSTFEDAGRCRRTYAVDGLGAAQFAVPVAVDRLRADRGGTVALAAVDPANAYGTAVPWPEPGRPARRAGAVVVLDDGHAVLYLDRGGSTLLAWTEDPDVLDRAARALADCGFLPRGVVRTINGEPATTRSDVTTALEAAGFLPTPRGLRGPRR
jgi:ATP-dependent Lhr-like helicase